MAATTDILRSWRAPRRVVRGLLDMGRREDRALAYLLVGCFVIFIAQLPRLGRIAYGIDPGLPDQSRSLTDLAGYEMFGWLMVWPLAFYAIAMILAVIGKLFGGRGSSYTVRLALFWAILASTPAALLYGLTVGVIGPGPAAQITGALWVIGFLWIAGSGYLEAQRAPEAP